MIPTRVEVANEDLGVFNDLLGNNSPGGYQKAESVKAKAGMGFDSMKGNSSGLMSPFENVTEEHILQGLDFTDHNNKGNRDISMWDQ